MFVDFLLTILIINLSLLLVFECFVCIYYFLELFLGLAYFVNNHYLLLIPLVFVWMVFQR